MIARWRRELAADERGSVLLLTLGYALLAIAVVIVCVDATALYLAQKRLDALADAAALAGADGFSVVAGADGPAAVLDDAEVLEQAGAIVEVTGGQARLVAATTPDGLSARVTVADTWHPPVLSPFVPGGITLESTATSRTALN